ncbi:MAG: hypothetical protein ACX94C_13035 [Phycisphaerales bacterium]
MMWETVYWVLLVIALVVLGRGLLWDRAGFRGRPKRRCRKCWYDLTGVDGDVSREPVVCPECGKAHKTKRSMRKTRRGKRWVVAAFGLWMLAYGASVTPKVQKNGWGAAVPRVVLVMSLPFISEEPGSGLTTAIPFSVSTIKVSAFEKMILDEIEREWRFSLYNPLQIESDFGWVSARLAFLLARMESESALCDGTTAKGRAYQCLITSLMKSDRAYSFEEAWARSQNEIDIEIDRGFGADEPVYGRVRMSTLVRDIETVRFGDHIYSYQAKPNRSGFGFGSGFGPGPSGSTPQEKDQSIIESNRWASLWNVKDDSGYSSLESGEYHLGHGYVDANGRFGVSVMVHFGQLKRNDEGQIDRDAEPVALHHERVFESYQIDEARSIVRDSSQALKDWIENSFQARLCVEFNRKEQAWVPVIQLKPKATEAWSDGALVFGGYVRVLEVPNNGDEYPRNEYMQGKHVWWGWAERVPSTDEEYIEITDENGSPFRFEVHRNIRPDFTARNSISIGRIGQLSPNTYAVGRGINTSSKMVVVFEANLSNQLRFGGLWGDVVYDGTLEFDLPKWTRYEFEQYIVNGIAPRHAFPGRE